jgi:hypothetical protein
MDPLTALAIKGGVGTAGRVVDKTPGVSFGLGFAAAINPFSPINIIVMAIYTTIISIIIYRVNPKFLRNNKETEDMPAKSKVTFWRATWVAFLIGLVIHIILGTVLYGFAFKGLAKAASFL